MQVQLGSPDLYHLIRDSIVRSPQQRLSFAEFMELALYHPDHGYYTTHPSQLGHAGDFVTAAHLGNDFGELLAEQFADMWQRLGQPNPFHLVEIGPGQGLLADTILSYWQSQYPDGLTALCYTLIEASDPLKSEQQSRLQPWQEQGLSLTWCALSDLPKHALTGCLFSNELVDALPVHRVTLTEKGLQEQYVTIAEQSAQTFQWTVGPLSTPALERYFKQLGVDLVNPPYPLGFTTEVNLAALDWLTAVAETLHRGYVLTIDYGYSAERFYSPWRSQGTLQCYYQHAHHDDPFINLGHQDITAHVDFTALEKQGQRCGLETLDVLPQELFLMALGLGDRLQQLAQLQGTDSATIAYALQRREYLHQLINPLGLGKFTVMVQGKGLIEPSQKQLRGLVFPA